MDEITKLRNALELIAECAGMTLLGEYCTDVDSELDKQHQIGANKAFNQCASIAQNALNKDIND
jgi:hypothetical protein